MQRDVKIGIAIGVLLIALIAIFWWVRNHQPAVNENEISPATNDTMPGPISPVAPVEGGTEVAGGAEIAAPGATTTTLPGAVPAVPGAPGTPGAVPPPPPAVQTHTVVSGDSLARISKQYYGTEAKWKLIADANQIAAPYTLKVGKTLTIPPADSTVTPAPAGGVPVTPSVSAKTHKVVAGETLTSISRKYYGDVTHVDAIYQANRAKMTSKNDLKVGMVLTIP